MKKIFINKNSQVRSGWKIASTFGLFFAATNMFSIMAMIFMVVIMLATKSVAPNNLGKYIHDMTKLNSGFGVLINSIQCLCMILAVWLFWKVYDKKPINEIGLISLKKGYKDLLKGLAYGSISMIMVFIILLISGNVALQGSFGSPNFNISLLVQLGLFILVGVNEEMFARGYCMTVLKQTGNKCVVVIIASLIFAVMHSLNPNMSGLSYINLFLYALLAAFMFLKSRNLWLSIGYHIMWNYFQGDIFGFQVSGLTTSSLYKLKTSENNIITGGKFGPEGGIVVTFIILVGIIYVWKVYKPQVFEKDK